MPARYKMKAALLSTIAAACTGGGTPHRKIIDTKPAMNDRKASFPASTASAYWLSQSDKVQLSENNDKDSAFRLSQYYSFVELNSIKEQYWLERSARAGHAVAQYNLACLLLNKESPDAVTALHWAEIAKENGESKAQLLIDEIRTTLG